MSRIAYERHLAESVQLGIEIRQRLFDTYSDLAEQAQRRREWEAASAFQYAAQLALGMQIQVVDSAGKEDIPSPNGPPLGDFGNPDLPVETASVG